jgi:beta-glucosidase
MGRALGEECLQEDVAVILGPGVNIKRSPLCGRNFEYFSEDPLLGGELAAALIEGIQEMGVGTSIKHYAANNQESKRMTIDAVADQRALREIYLKSFEIPIKKAKPWTVMCSYNRIGGVYSSDNPWLLTEVLRDTWGYEGLVMTDWGAMNDRVQAVLAGLDLEMPASNGVNDAKIVAAVQNGKLKESDVDKLAARVTEMILKAQAGRRTGYTYDASAHHKLARKAAAESCVLLKNEEQILPLKAGAKIAVIGGFAKAPRYQGAGSSKINPSQMDNALDELAKLGYEAAYAEGYTGTEADDGLIAEAVKTAAEADTAIVFAGLPDEYESEGFDRKSLAMPSGHTKLIREVAKANPNTVVVLQLGAPVLTDWAADVKALLVSYLGGQAGGGGAADVLAGIVCPGGKLAESWPLALEDNPSFHYFPGGKKTVEYRESIFVGYRYYETAKKPVAWPFGYGLSYTSFEYGNFTVSGNEVSLSVTNTGGVAGSEAVQIYAGIPGSKIFRPVKWLAAFEKVRLAPGETKNVSFKLEKEHFEYYNTAANGWRVEGGAYTIEAGASVCDIRFTGTMDVIGDGDESLLAAQKSLGYFNITDNIFNEKDFTVLYGKPLPPNGRLPGEPYTVNNTLDDISHTPIGKRIIEGATKQAADALGLVGDDIARMVSAMLLDMPLRAMGMMAGRGLPPNFPEMVVNTLNGSWFSRTAATIRFGMTMARMKKK